MGRRVINGFRHSRTQLLLYFFEGLLKFGEGIFDGFAGDEHAD